MNVAFAIMFFLVGALTNEVWRSILGVGFTVRVCRETVYQTFKLSKLFTNHIEVILAFQYKAMKNAGMDDQAIEDTLEVNVSVLSLWKQAVFNAIMSETPVLVKDHFLQKGWTSFDSVFEEENKLDTDAK